MRTGFTSAAAIARGSGRGEQTKEQLLAAAAEERKVRAEERRQRDAALRIQRVWRASHAWHVARLELLAAWQTRWGAVDRPESVDLLALLPLIVCSRRRRDGALTSQALGAPALARGMALFVASCPASLAQALLDPRGVFLAAGVVNLAASALSHPPASDNPDVVSAVCCRAIACASDAAAWTGAPSEGAYSHFLRRCLAPCACALGHLLSGGAASSRSAASLLSLLMKALADPTLSSDAAEALVTWVLFVPRGLAAAQSDVLRALREPVVLQGVLRAMAQCRDPSSNGAAWALTHAVQLVHARGGDAALVGSFMDAVAVLSQHASAPAMLCSAAGTADACDAMRQAAVALESPPMLQMLLDSGVPAGQLTAFYWPMLRSTSMAGIQRMDALRVLNTLAFSPQLLSVLWTHCAQELKIPHSLALGGQPTAWEPAPLCHGLAGVPAHCVPPLGVFASSLEHVLLVLSDEELHAALRPLPLNSTRAVAAAVNTLVICTYLPRGSTHGTRATGLDAERAAVLDACTQLLRSLVARNARRRFCDDALWLAPARHVTMHIPAAARAFAASAEEGPVTTRDLLVSCPHARPFDERTAVFRALCSSDRQQRRATSQPGGADARGAFCPTPGIVTAEN